MAQRLFSRPLVVQRALAVRPDLKDMLTQPTSGPARVNPAPLQSVQTMCNCLKRKHTVAKSGVTGIMAGMAKRRRDL